MVRIVIMLAIFNTQNLTKQLTLHDAVTVDKQKHIYSKHCPMISTVQ